MTYDEVHDAYVLSSGRRFYAHNGVIGINAELQVFEGHDGGFEVHGGELTLAERGEIAKHMIDLWTDWWIETAVSQIR